MKRAMLLLAILLITATFAAAETMSIEAMVGIQWMGFSGGGANPSIAVNSDKPRAAATMSLNWPSNIRRGMPLRLVEPTAIVCVLTEPSISDDRDIQQYVTLWWYAPFQPAEIVRLGMVVETYPATGRTQATFYLNGIQIVQLTIPRLLTDLRPGITLTGFSGRREFVDWVIVDGVRTDWNTDGDFEGWFASVPPNHLETRPAVVSGGFLHTGATPTSVYGVSYTK